MSLTAKCYFFVSIIFFMVGCATYEPEMQIVPEERININEITDNDTLVDIPENFEKTMPESPLILNGMVVFQKKYITETISDNVSDFSFDNETLVFLKNNTLYLNDEVCRSIATKNIVKNIQLSDGLILTYDSNDIFVYSIAHCGEIFSLKREFGKISLSPPYIIQYNNVNFSISKIGSTEKPLTGGLNVPIKDVYFLNGVIYFLDNENRLAPLILNENISGELVGTFAKPIFLPENIKIITAYGNYLYAGNNNYIVQYALLDIGLKKINEYNIEKTENCEFIKTNALKCGDEIFSYKQNTFFKLGNVEKAHVTDNSILYLEKNNLHIIYTDKRYFVKEILLARPEISLCKSGSKYYLNDWDGRIKEIETDTYSSNVTEHIPEDCIYGFRFKEGYFIDERTNLKIKVAEQVNENSTHKMYLRKIEDSYYYYFEEKNSVK